MHFIKIIGQLDAEWDESGFFCQLRDGIYDESQALNVLNILRSIHICEDDLLPKRLVSLLWYLPSFLSWQSARVVEKGGDGEAYEKFIVEVHSILEDMLGTP